MPWLIDIVNPMPELHFFAIKDLTKPGLQIQVDLMPSGRRLVDRQDLAGTKQAVVTCLNRGGTAQAGATCLDLMGDTYVEVRRYGDIKGSVTLRFDDVDRVAPIGAITSPANGTVTSQASGMLAAYFDDPSAQMSINGQPVDTYHGDSEHANVEQEYVPGVNGFEACGADQCGNRGCATT